MEPKPNVKTWNPWSYDIFNEFCDGKFPDKNAHYDESLYVSKLDEILVQKMGVSNYLLAFTELSYRAHLKEAKTEIVKRMMVEIEGTPKPNISELARHMGRVDLINNRVYTKEDIPPLPIPIQTKIHLKVAKFEDMDKFAAYPIDEPFSTYRRRLCRMLEEYCEDPDLKILRLPNKGELALVKVPTWKEIDCMMRREKGKNREWWDPRLHRRTNPDDDGWMAGKWFRGICVENCSRSQWRISEVYEFYLVDVGRNVVVHESNIQSGVLRFASIPSLSVQGALLLQSMKPKPGETDELKLLPRHTPEELKTKWYNLFPRGTVFPCTVLYHIFDTTVVIMPVEIEKKFDKIHEEKSEKCEKELHQRNKHLKSLKGDENIDNYLISLADLNFDS